MHYVDSYVLLIVNSLDISLNMADRIIDKVLKFIPAKMAVSLQV